MAIWSPSVETQPGSTTNVTATDLDIRDLNSATDSIAAIGPVTDAQLRATPVPVSGPLTDTQLRATPVPVSGPLTDAQLRATPVPVTATIAVSSTATVTRFTVTTNATLLASNASRKRFVIFNENAILYVKFGATATTTSYTIQLLKNSTFEYEGYTGQVDAISSGSSPVQVTDLT